MRQSPEWKRPVFKATTVLPFPAKTLATRNSSIIYIYIYTIYYTTIYTQELMNYIPLRGAVN